MKHLLLLVFLGISLSSFSQKNKKALQWHSWEEGIELAEKKNKKVIVDIYTDWCGFCKRMDKETFTDPTVIKYLKKNFVMIKLDGESKETLTYKGKEYNFTQGGRRGYNELGKALVGRKPPYPTMVFLDKDQNVIKAEIGYKAPIKFYPLINFYGSGSYKDQDYRAYVESFKSPFAPKASE